MPKVRILMAGRSRLRKGDPGGLAFDSRGRHVATRLEKGVIFFRCPCGTEYGVDFERAPVPYQLTGDGLELMFKRWSDGSSAAPCPDCLRTYRRKGELPARVAPVQPAVTVASVDWAKTPKAMLRAKAIGTALDASHDADGLTTLL